MRAVLIAGMFVSLAAARALAQEPPAAEATAAEPPAPEATAAEPPAPEATAAEPPVSSDLIMSASELAALGLESSEPSVDPSLQLGGFLDVGFGTIFARDDSYWHGAGNVPGHSTFYVGNFNLYVRKDLASFLRVMGEVRFSYLPNGSSVFGTQERASTVAADYTDFGRETRWGGIIIERAYVELLPHPYLSIRVGEFLTPYGVWNVDHGSPVVIPVRRPWVVGAGWFPQRQTGIEIFGRTDVGHWGAGYHITLSNGTGPVSEYADLDANKAVGGRLFVEYQNLGVLRLGASAYYGRETDNTYTFTGVSVDKIRANEILKTQFDSLSWAGDLTWDFGDLHLQTEWIVNQRAFTTKGRAAITNLDGNMLIPSDVLSWGGYGLIGYRLPWLGIMPFFEAERASGVLGYQRVRLMSFQFGLNVRPIESLVFKATLDRVILEDSFLEPVTIFQTQIAVAY